MDKTLVVIAGPTAIGKTKIAVELALHFNTSVVSCDSRQIYREMKIGTAVPSTEELKSVPHFFLQSHPATQPYNASMYESEAIGLLDNLFKKTDTVIMAGGSMLYIDAVCRGIDQMPDADLSIREHLKQVFKEQGIEALRLQLKRYDPGYYEKVDLKNTARIIHALEICLTTGKPFSHYLKKTVKKRNFNIIKIALDCDRNLLHQRINDRVDTMIRNGLENEARNLSGLRNLVALNTVGYREFFSFFDDEISFEQAVELIKRNTRRYARKQLTWFRNDNEYTWFSPQQVDEIIQYIENETGAKK